MRYRKPGRGRAQPLRAFTLAALALALLLAAGAYALLRGQEKAAPALAADPNVRVGTLTQDPERRRAELQAVVDESAVSFSINATPSFESGAAPGNLMIENHAGARNKFTVSVYRTDTDELVYQSGTIAPGQYIESAALDVPLAAGEYPCEAYFDAYRLADDTFLGRAGAKLTLYILS